MTIKLKNISGRNFNGIENNATVNVDEKVKNTYLIAGFVEVKTETKKEEAPKKVEVKTETKKNKKK